MKIECGESKYLIGFVYQGRTTIAQIERLVDDKREWYGSATADCSVSDNFSRRVGRKIALRRALESAFTRDERKQIWPQIVASGMRLITK